MAARLTPSLRGIETVALIGIGGFAGANLRFAVGQLGPALPTTLVINTLGSFLLGLVVYEALRTDRLSTKTRLIVSTGFLSSFTTYSTFALQSVLAHPVWLGLNVLGTYGLGFAGVVAGREIASRMDTGRNR